MKLAVVKPREQKHRSPEQHRAEPDFWKMLCSILGAMAGAGSGITYGIEEEGSKT